MDVSSGDYYRRLQVSPTASRQEIKKAFRRLARRYHPDMHPNQPDALAKFKGLSEAYEVLSDRIQRQRYDQQNSLKHNSAQSSAKRSRTDSTPQTAADFYIQGICRTLAHRYQAALKAYTQAIALDPQLAEAYLRRAEVHSLLEQDSEVLTDCSAAIALDPNEAKTHYYQGLARYRLGYVQSAIAAFSQAIALDPEDARYHRWRAIAHRDIHEQEEAALDFRSAAKLYRAQGNRLDYQSVQRSLKRLGTAGLAQPQKLLIRSVQRVTSPLQKLIRNCSSRYNRRQLAVSTSHHPDNDSDSNATEAPPARSSQNWLPLSQDEFDRLPNQPLDQTVDRFTDQFTDRFTDRSVDQPWPPKLNSREEDAYGDSSARYHSNQPARRRQDPNNPYINPFKKGHYSSHYWPTQWPANLRTRPNKALPFHQRLASGAKTILKLASNPGGEVISAYRRICATKHSVVGYGIAVLANLFFILGVSQYFSNNSWLLTSQLWATGAFTFVSMVLTLSLIKLKTHTRGRWSADIFILGTALLPLGLFAIASAIATLAAAYLSTLGLSELALPLLLLSLGICALWTFAQSFITLYSGLTRLHQFPHQLAAWLSPVILSFGLLSGTITWLLLAT